MLTAPRIEDGPKDYCIPEADLVSDLDNREIVLLCASILCLFDGAIPVGRNAIAAYVTISPTITLVLFHVGFKGCVEGNVVANVEAAYGGDSVSVQRHVAHGGKGGVKERKGRIGGPCVAEVVFAAGSKGGGEVLAVYEELFIALTPPPVQTGFTGKAEPPVVSLASLGIGIGVINQQMHAAEAAAALRAQHQPVWPTLAAGAKNRVIFPLWQVVVGKSTETHQLRCICTGHDLEPGLQGGAGFGFVG